MSFFKTYLRPNKKEAISLKQSSPSTSAYLAQNGSHCLISPRSLQQGEHTSKESNYAHRRNRKRSAKSSPLPMGNGTPSRMGLVGSAKVIQTLGADSLDEAMEILTIMQRPNPSTHNDDSFRSSDNSEDSEFMGHFQDRKGQNSEILALKTYYSPAICEVYAHALTGQLAAHESYPDCKMDWQWSSSEGQFVPFRQEEPGFSEIGDIKNSKIAPRRNSVSTWDCGSGFGPSTSDYRNSHDSPQLSSRRPNHHQAHPLPTPPSSPSKLDRMVGSERLAALSLVPKKLPLPPPANMLEKDLENHPRSQQNHFWKMQLHSQSPCSSNSSPGARLSPVSAPQCPRNWTKGRFLGKGSFGTVYEGLNVDDGSFFAVKISDVETAAPEVRQEVNVLSRLNHPNIVRYLGSSVEDGHLCIFLELVGMGSLRSVLDKYKRFEENMIRTYTRQILWGLEYLHQQNTIHRDIKCANILVHPNGQVKLADFGVAKQIIKPLTDNRRYGLAVDIWSLGCTIIEMADGRAPWSDLEGFSFFFKVSRGELPPIPEHLSFEAKDFIRRCLKLKPEERSKVSELLHHPFVANDPAVAPPLSPPSQRPHL